MKKGDGKIVRASVLGRNKVEFCMHALDQMEIRDISEQEVIRTIQQPTRSGLKVNPPLPFRRHVRRDISPTKSIDVIYEELLDRIVVITAYPKLWQKKK